jgi:hypothetical protein
MKSIVRKKKRKLAAKQSLLGDVVAVGDVEARSIRGSSALCASF